MERNNPKITRRPVENAGSSTGKTELIWPNKRTKVEPVELPFQAIEVII